MRRTAQQRFNSKWTPEPNTGCWLWTAGLDAYGYGQFSIGTKKIKAHRFAYEQKVGPIPEGLTIDHRCRVRSCVNPTHMEPVTHQENMRRVVWPTGLNHYNGKKTHCKNGHPYNDENTYLMRSGGRTCRACQRLWYAKRKDGNK